MIHLPAGKLSLLLDGQFGSTGKGLFAQYIGMRNHVDVAVSNASSNAGHTFYYASSSKTKPARTVVRHLPISGILNKRSTIYLCAGAIINPDILLAEISDLNIDPARVIIHPRAAIIEPSDVAEERTNPSGVKTIASTMSGVGSALTRKISRGARLAGDVPVLQQFVSVLDLQGLLADGCTAMMEVPQGMDLSLNHGFAYPYCTSRDITPSAALSDAGVHPRYLGAVAVSMRTFPIRVGNVIENEVVVGNSGPFYADSVETTWEDLGLEKEYTTCTKRVRRVATFSFLQYAKMLKVMCPDYVFLNFCNYLSPDNLAVLLPRLSEVTHLGFGPEVKDIRAV